MDWPRSLQAEGRAMLQAVAGDLAVGGFDVVVALHPAQPRLGLNGVQTIEGQPDFASTLETADAEDVLLIAPEIDGILLRLACTAEASGRRLVSPSRRFVELFSDKLKTADVLGALAVPTDDVPEAIEKDAIGVIKPRFGAGSEKTYVGKGQLLAAEAKRLAAIERGEEFVFQPFWEGTPSSIGICFGAEGNLILPAALQEIEARLPSSETGLYDEIASLRYRGGIAPLPDSPLLARGRRLAELAADRFPDLRGYVGIDVILGADPQGSDDRICEINPRLTLSYVGYSRLYGPKLAEFVAGKGSAKKKSELEEIIFRGDGRVHFDHRGVTALT